MKSGQGTGEVTEDVSESTGVELEDPWFVEGEAEGTSRRRSSAPPEKLGEFLGDELADAWLR